MSHLDKLKAMFSCLANKGIVSCSLLDNPHAFQIYSMFNDQKMTLKTLQVTMLLTRCPVVNVLCLDKIKIRRIYETEKDASLGEVTNNYF